MRARRTRLSSSVSLVASSGVRAEGERKVGVPPARLLHPRPPAARMLSGGGDEAAEAAEAAAARVVRVVRACAGAAVSMAFTAEAQARRRQSRALGTPEAPTSEAPTAGPPAVGPNGAAAVPALAGLDAEALRTSRMGT